MSETRTDRHQVALAIDRASLRASVSAALAESCRYHAPPVTAAPVAVVADARGLQRWSADLSRRRAAGCPVVVVVSDTDRPGDIAKLDSVDAYISEHKVARLLSSTIVLSAEGMTPLPGQVTALQRTWHLVEEARL